MAKFRESALNNALNREIKQIANYEGKISSIFGSMVFNKEAMRENLPSYVFDVMQQTIDLGDTVDSRIADQVAAAMKAWAINKGATHYTHWFQPLNGATAEKHDAFFTPLDGLKSLERFEGKNLVQQEPDASSFPSGGIRNTFEARGYTAWDPSSPAFIMGSTLCIPTIFISYTGESLDFKAPLLKSINAIDKAAVEVCNLFDKNITKVYPTLGWEQEYFLIDEALYFARPDIVMTGRTVFGHSAAKDQQLDDHYFGSIPERATAFMKEFELEAWKLGIPVKTRHNEVAPNQFELAPVYEEVNIAIDHNQLVMEIMAKTARNHHFKILFHEKPFAGINGSGKHNNWSLATNDGRNLLSPGKTPKSNMLFLTFFINTIKAVNDHAALLRAAIASAGNDYRLGASEAPPAIISVFIGEYLTRILNDIEKHVKKGKMLPDEKTELKLNIGKIPRIILDNTDRNRTSPFAFTGDKFEFRAVGSSANCSPSMIVLNSIVANQLAEFKKDVDGLMLGNDDKKDEAILKVLRNYIIDSKKVLFEGNGYCKDWENEAQKRGLQNIKDTPRSLDAYISDSTQKMFAATGIFSNKELEARFHIKHEIYSKTIQIESKVIGDIASNHIIPTAIRYQNLLIENVKGLKKILTDKEFSESAAYPLQLIREILEHIYGIQKNVSLMKEARIKAYEIFDIKEQSIYWHDNVKPFFDIIRFHADKLETHIDDELWPLPKYRELLFVR